MCVCVWGGGAGGVVVVSRSGVVKCFLVSSMRRKEAVKKKKKEIPNFTILCVDAAPSLQSSVVFFSTVVFFWSPIKRVMYFTVWRNRPREVTITTWI